MSLFMKSMGEARSIILGWQKDGLKVGFVAAGGCFHEGHQYLCIEARKYCDKIVINASSYASKEENKWDYDPCTDFWERFTDSSAILLNSFRYVGTGEMNDIINQHVDLALNPQPIDHINISEEEGDDVRAEVIRYKDFFKKNYEMEVLDMEVAIHIWYYWIDKYQWPVQVRIRSWKDGVWNLRHQVYWKDVIGREYVVITPKYGKSLILSSRLEYVNPTKLECLRTVIGNMQMEKTTTRETIEQALKGTGIDLREFDIYSGPLLKYVGDNKILITMHFAWIGIGKEISGYTHVELV